MHCIAFQVKLVFSPNPFYKPKKLTSLARQAKQWLGEQLTTTVQQNNGSTQNTYCLTCAYFFAFSW